MKPMNQETINQYFQSDLGRQCGMLFSTSDNRVFIREEEALQHVDGKRDLGTKPLADKTILTWCDESPQKFLYVMRGCPGSGKSTVAKTLVIGKRNGQEPARDGVILSTDDFWMKDGVYTYDKARIGEAHRWNEKRAFEAFEAGISPVVIDNTNITAFSMKPYVEVALHFGYEVKIVEPTTPWAFDAEELTKRNTHGVPREVIDKMLIDWEKDLTVEDIEKSKPPTLIDAAVKAVGSSVSVVVLKERIIRDADSTPCLCGGYADRVECTKQEIKQYGCGRDYECCSRAFVCRVCCQRLVGCAEAADPW